MMPSVCPICGQSKMQAAGEQVETLTAGVLMTFEVYECLSEKDQCAARRWDGQPGTRILVPKVGAYAASVSGGTEVVSVEAPPDAAGSATGV